MADFLTAFCAPSYRTGEAGMAQLPPLLIGLTLVTGLVDAFSYLTLGHAPREHDG